MTDAGARARLQWAKNEMIALRYLSRSISGKVSNRNTSFHLGNEMGARLSENSFPAKAILAVEL